VLRKENESLRRENERLKRSTTLNSTPTNNGNFTVNFIPTTTAEAAPSSKSISSNTSNTLQ